MTTKVEGVEETLAALDKFGAQGKAEARKGLRATGQKVRTDAIRSIQQGPKTGRVYESSTFNVKHQASAPGQPPATDTGNLVSSGTVRVRGLSGQVAFTAPYAFWLEYGTRVMDARPFLNPAMKKNEKFLVEQLQKALDRAAGEFNRER